MSVISHSCICAGTVPLEQMESLGGRAGARGYFLNEGTNTPNTTKSSLQSSVFHPSLLEPWAGFLPCSGGKGDVPRAVQTTTDRSTRGPAAS